MRLSILPSAHIFPRVLIATIGDKGACPCPRCLVRADQIPELGTPADRTRREATARKDDSERQSKVARAASHIYDDGYVINSERVEAELKSESLIPTFVGPSSATVIGNVRH